MHHSCNPKEYFEMLEDKNTNKKHKGIKKVPMAYALKTSPRE